MSRSTLLLAATLTASVAHANPEINWFSFDAGGGESTGGAYTLRHAIGQHDAGPQLTSGSFRVRGGFLTAPTSPQPCGQADLALPFGVIDLADIGAFVDGFLNSQPIADFDDNGIFDLADIGIFVDAFLTGCP